MDACRKCGHVAQHTRAVVYVVDEHHGNVVAEQVLDARGIDALQAYARVATHAGNAFRREILSKGDSEDPAKLYRNFMGRDPDPSALLVRSGLA